MPSPTSAAAAVLVAALSWGGGAGEVGFHGPANDAAYDDPGAIGPQAVAVGPDGRVWIADTVNDRVIALGEGGAVVARIAHPGVRAPSALAMGADGSLAVGLAGPGAVVRLDERGGVLGAWGRPRGAAPDLIAQLWALAAGPGGRIAAGDLALERVHVLDAPGRVAATLPWSGTGLAIAADGSVLDLHHREGEGYALRARTPGGAARELCRIPGAARENGRVLGVDRAGRVYMRFAGGEGRLEALAFDPATARLASAGELPFATSPHAVAVHPHGGIVWLEYDADAAPGGSVRVLTRWCR